MQIDWQISSAHFLSAISPAPSRVQLSTLVRNSCVIFSLFLDNMSRNVAAPIRPLCIFNRFPLADQVWNHLLPQDFDNLLFRGRAWNASPSLSTQLCPNNKSKPGMLLNVLLGFLTNCHSNSPFSLPLYPPSVLHRSCYVPWWPGHFPFQEMKLLLNMLYPTGIAQHPPWNWNQW